MGLKFKNMCQGFSYDEMDSLASLNTNSIYVHVLADALYNGIKMLMIRFTPAFERVVFSKTDDWRVAMYVPRTKGIAETTGWGQVEWYESIFHQHSSKAGSNLKYLSPDGRLEAIYDEYGILVLDPRDVGTYNLMPSTVNKWGHFKYDVLPCFLYGTGSGDPTYIINSVYRN